MVCLFASSCVFDVHEQMIFLDERNDLTLLFISCTGRPMRIEIVLAPATAQAVLPQQRHAPRLENWTFGNEISEDKNREPKKAY